MYVICRYHIVVSLHEADERDPPGYLDAWGRARAPRVEEPIGAK